jgi:dihydroorotate dehydrogenase (fumarate)
MADLRTRYLGLELRSPLVASSSPLTGSLDGLRKLEAAGAGAVVLPSLFEEELAADPGPAGADPQVGQPDQVATAPVRPPTWRWSSGPSRRCPSR